MFGVGGQTGEVDIPGFGQLGGLSGIHGGYTRERKWRMESLPMAMVLNFNSSWEVQVPNSLGLAKKAEVEPRGAVTSHREGIAQLLWGYQWAIHGSTTSILDIGYTVDPKFIA